MSDRVPIGTIPTSDSDLVGVDILIGTFGVAVTITRLLLRHTDYDDSGATNTQCIGSIRNATGGGGSGIAFTIPDQGQSVVVSGSLSVLASESVYLRVTTGGAVAANLTGWIEADAGAADVTTALTTLARLKQFLKITVGTDDALLANIIAGVSKRAQRHMGRTIVSSSIVGEIHDGALPEEDRLLLLRHPITAIAEIRIDGVVLAAANYQFDAASGIVYRRDPDTPSADADDWDSGRRNIAVDYTQGYAAIPEDLIDAATKQAAYVWKQSTPGGARLGERSVLLDGGGSGEYLTGPWATGVLGVLDSYRVPRAA